MNLDALHSDRLVQAVQRWVEPARRDWIDLVFRFDAQIAHVARRRGLPELARIRLAWWRTAVVEASAGDPLLKRVALCDEGARAQLATIVDGWDQIVGAGGVDAWCAHADQRGNAVFAAIASGWRPGEKWSGARWAMLSATRLWPDHPDVATARALSSTLPHLPRSAPRALHLIEAHVDGRGTAVRRWWRAMRG